MLVAAMLFLALPQSAPAALTDATFGSVKAHASPTPKDLAFQSIDWKTSIYEGLQAAQKADKPLLLWMYFGDPRGRC